MNRAVGHIDERQRRGLMATPESPVTATFFRGLKDIVPGESHRTRGCSWKKEATASNGSGSSTPEDVSVLDPTPTRSLTLVTCYPFYYVGPAPQRYIVRAVRGRHSGRSSGPLSRRPMSGTPQRDGRQCALSRSDHTT